MVHDKENAGNATAAPTEIMPQKASAADTVPTTNAHAGGAAPPQCFTDSACVVVDTVVLTCVWGGVCVDVGLHTNACTHVRIRARTLSGTHARKRTSSTTRASDCGVRIGLTICLFILYTHAHFHDTLLCLLSSPQTNEHAHARAHTRTHAQSERERESRAGSKRCWRGLTCVLTLLYVSAYYVMCVSQQVQSGAGSSRSLMSCCCFV
jgi:hypothetical protein